MDCQRCGTKTRVVEVLDYPDRVERRRRCKNPECGYRSVTIEVHHRDSTYFGRIPKTARITREEALEVKAMLAEGKLSQRQIGEKVGLSQQQVSKIARGLSWGYVKPSKVQEL